MSTQSSCFFNFGSRTFAYKRLAEGLNRSLSAFTSVFRDYLDLVSKAERRAQYVHDIANAAHTASELIENLDHVFQQSQIVGLKLTIEKFQFGEQSIVFLRKTIFTAVTAPIEERIAKFLKNLKLPSSVKTSQRHLGFVNFYKKTTSNLQTS